MSSGNGEDKLRDLLGEIDVGHYRSTLAYLAPKVKNLMAQAEKVLRNAPEFLPGDPPDVSLDREMEPLLPMEDFERIVQKYHNSLVDKARGDYSLKELEREISEDLEHLEPRIDKLESRIEPLEEVRDHFKSLADRFTTLDSVAEAGALKSEVQRRYQLPPGSQFQICNHLPAVLRIKGLPENDDVKFEPFYDARDLFQSERMDLDQRAGCYAYRGNGSPIRIATRARAEIKGLNDELRPKGRAKAIAELRLRILEYIRRHNRMVGFLPEKIDVHDGSVTSIRNQDNAHSDENGGRPSALDVDELRDKVIEIARVHCDCWHDEDSRYDGLNKRKVYLRIRRDSPRIVQNPRDDNFLNEDYVQSKISEIFGGMPQDVKEELKENACGG